MMKIEKQLAKTDLNQFKQKPLEIVVKGIYKHQRFKTNEIIKRINCVHYKENTVQSEGLRLYKLNLHTDIYKSHHRFD